MTMTQTQSNPWIEYSPGDPRPVGRVVVRYQFEEISRYVYGLEPWVYGIATAAWKAPRKCWQGDHGQRIYNISHYMFLENEDTLMNDVSRLPPGRELLRSDWFIEQLGNSNQKVMSLTVENQRLRKHVEKLESLLLENGIEW